MIDLYYRIISLLVNIRYSYLRKRQIHLCRGGSLLVGKKSKLVLGNGYLFINRRHFPHSYRPLSGMLWVEDNAEFRLDGEHFSMCEGSRIHLRKCSVLHIEGNSFINTSTEIDVYSKVFIGHGTIISSNCYITDSDQHDVVLNGVKLNKTKPIHIGKSVWIGRNVTILKGVVIGDNAVIASNSLVNKNVGTGELWGGIPARKLKEGIKWER